MRRSSSRGRRPRPVRRPRTRGADGADGDKVSVEKQAESKAEPKTEPKGAADAEADGERRGGARREPRRTAGGRGVRRRRPDAEATDRRRRAAGAGRPRGCGEARRERQHEEVLTTAAARDAAVRLPESAGRTRSVESARRFVRRRLSGGGPPGPAPAGRPRPPPRRRTGRPAGPAPRASVAAARTISSAASISSGPGRWADSMTGSWRGWIAALPRKPRARPCAQDRARPSRSRMSR